MGSRIVLNTAAVDQLVREAGLTDGEFARQFAQIHPITYSHARNGGAMHPSTLRAIALGLSRLKPLSGFARVPGRAVIAKEEAVVARDADHGQEGSRVSANPK